MASPYSSERPRRATSKAALELIHSLKRTSANDILSSPQSSSTKTRRVSNDFSEQHDLPTSQGSQLNNLAIDRRKDNEITHTGTTTMYKYYPQSVHVDDGQEFSASLSTRIIDTNSSIRIAYPSLHTSINQQKTTSDMKQFSDVKPDKDLLDVKPTTWLIAKPCLNYPSVRHMSSAFVSLPMLSNDVIIKAQSGASQVLLNENIFTKIKTEPQECTNTLITQGNRLVLDQYQANNLHYQGSSISVHEGASIGMMHAREVTTHPQNAEYISSAEKISKQNFIANVKTEPEQSGYNVENLGIAFASVPETELAPSLSYDSEFIANIKTEPEALGFENSDDRSIECMETDINLVSSIKIEPFISDYYEENNYFGISGVCVETDNPVIEENNYIGISGVSVKTDNPVMEENNYIGISGVSVKTDNPLVEQNNYSSVFVQTDDPVVEQNKYLGISGVSAETSRPVIEQNNYLGITGSGVSAEIDRPIIQNKYLGVTRSGISKETGRPASEDNNYLGTSRVSLETDSLVVIEKDVEPSTPVEVKPEPDSESDFEPSSEFETDSGSEGEDDSDGAYVPGKPSPPKVAVKPAVSSHPADVPVNVDALIKAPGSIVKIVAKTKSGDKPPIKEGKNNLKTTMKGGMAEVWCTLCNVKCLTEKAIITHKKPHNPQQAYQCVKCHKSFATPACLSTHLSSKTDICMATPTPTVPKPILPKEIEAVLETSDDKSHFKTIINKGIGDVWCTICSYKCESPSDILLHRKPHEPRTIYKCKKCSKYLDSAADLKIHKCDSAEEKRKKVPPAQEGRTSVTSSIVIRDIDERFTCSECDVVCSDKSSLQQHMTMQHEEMLTCTRCGVTCYSLLEMEAHIKTHNS